MYRYIIIFLCFLTLNACDRIESQYYVRYEVEAITPSAVIEYTDVLVQTSLNRNDVTRFYCKEYWSEDFGPFTSGDHLLIIADSPNLDTYFVRIFIRRNDCDNFQLVNEGLNQAEYTIE